MNKMFKKKINVLTINEAKAVLNVLTTNTIMQVLNAAEGDCPGYHCCPCDADTGGSCGCEGYCHCASNAYIDLRRMEIYESMRNADPVTYKQVMAMVRAKAK